MGLEQAPALKTAQTLMPKAKQAAAAEEMMPDSAPVRDTQEDEAKPKFAKSLTERIKSGKQENDPN